MDYITKKTKVLKILLIMRQQEKKNSIQATQTAYYKNCMYIHIIFVVVVINLRKRGSL